MVPYTIILPTVYGQVLVNRHDINQTKYLLEHSKAIDHEEITAISQFIEPGTSAIDVGACFGLWTLAFAKRAAAVYTFEPQRVLYNCLCGTMALNSIENVYPFNWAVGSERGVVDLPKFDYHKPLQFGGVCAVQSPAQQNAGQEKIGTEPVHLATLDSLKFPPISLIKIDAEGMDFDVVLGARETIKMHRPVVHFETLFLGEEDFREFFEPLNYKCVKNNDNTLAVPKEKYEIETPENGQPVITMVQKA